jgi:hypothetical protein
MTERDLESSGALVEAATDAALTPEGSDAEHGAELADADHDGEPVDGGAGRKKKKKKKGKDGLGTSRGIETMFRTSYRTHLELSALADTKANIMLSINGIIISITIASMSSFDANPWLIVPTAALLVTCMISMVFAILAARPRVSSHAVSLEDVRSNKANILFFGNFVNMKEEDYLTGMHELMGNTEQLYSNMIRDIYSLGSVLERKYALVHKAYTIFMWGMGVSVLGFVAVLLWLSTWAGTEAFSVG